MPIKSKAGAGGLRAADPAKQGDGAELAVDDSCRFQLARASRVHPCGEVAGGRADLIDFFTRTIDFEFGDRRAADAAPAEHVLTAALGMPKDFVSLCLAWENELAYCERGGNASGLAPGFGRRLHRRNIGQMLP